MLLRLKEQLGIPTDKEVAELLGLSDKAFNARKRRDAFPDDKLLALMAKQPELKIDYDYIVTGIRSSEFEKVAAAHMPEHMREPGKTALLSIKEEEIVACYRRANEAGKAAIHAAAQALAEQFKSK